MHHHHATSFKILHLLTDIFSTYPHNLAPFDYWLFSTQPHPLTLKILILIIPNKLYMCSHPHNPTLPCCRISFLSIILSSLTPSTSLVCLSPFLKKLLFDVSLPEYCSFVHLMEVSTEANILPEVYNVQDHPDVFLWGDVGGHAWALRQQRRWGYSWRSGLVAVDVERWRVPERNGKTIYSVPCQPLRKKYSTAKPMNLFINSKIYN